MSSWAKSWTSLSREQQRMWKIIGGICVVGSGVKFAYFKFAQDLITTTMDANHRAAMKHIRQTDEFAQKFASEHARRLPPLTKDQHDQLQKYLAMRQKERPDLHAPPGNYHRLVRNGRDRTNERIHAH